VAESLIILDGRTFFYSDARGDVEAPEAEGFFVDDVRHLSHWRLTVDGQPPKLLTSRRVDYFSALVVGIAGETDEGPALAVRRERFATDGLHEDLVVQNLTRAERSVRLELAFGSDFSDVMEAQERAGRPPGKHSAELRARQRLPPRHDRLVQQALPPRPVESCLRRAPAARRRVADVHRRDCRRGGNEAATAAPLQLVWR
jgi:hypothetical protein